VLTENRQIEDQARRKRALREAVAADDDAAREIYVADKLARLRAAEREGTPPSPDKLDHYRRSWELLASRGKPVPYLDELAARLKAQPRPTSIHNTPVDRAARLRDATRSLTAARRDGRRARPGAPSPRAQPPTAPRSREGPDGCPP
jgi:hypothetical protein